MGEALLQKFSLVGLGVALLRLYIEQVDPLGGEEREQPEMLQLSVINVDLRYVR